MAYDVLAEGKDISTYEVAFADSVTKKYNKANADNIGITIPDGYEAIAE